MLQRIKKYIKKFPLLYQMVIYWIMFLGAVRKVTLNYDSIREFNYWRRGFIDLGPGNFKFYSNIFPRILKKCEGDTSSVIVLDVGANDGWFAKVVYRFLDSNATVISFEPLRSMIPKLEKLAKKYRNYRYENIAVGDSSDKFEITEYCTSGLSSLKGLSSSYEYNTNNFDTRVANKYLVNVVSIDQYIADKGIINPLILKIDTQGFEFEVLNGAVKAFSTGQIKAVIVEVMTVEKYAGAVLYMKIFNFLHSYNFSIFDMHPSYYEVDGKLSEFDCAFLLSPR